jgi:type II secretory pathway component PulF
MNNSITNLNLYVQGRIAFDKTKTKVEKTFSELQKPRLSLKDQIFFAKRLSFFIHAGVPLIEAIDIIRMQTRSKAKKELFNGIQKDIAEGQYLATSLARSGGVFNDFAINIIRVGEGSGILKENLTYLADELTKRKELRSKVMSALIYPAFITIATFGITILLTVFIFPKIMPIFVSLHVPLPVTTRALIAISLFLKTWGLLTLFILIVIGIAVLILRNTYPRVRHICDSMLLSLPLAGGIAKNYNLANYSRTLGLMLRSGIPITTAMGVVSETTPNLLYKNAYTEITDSLVRGETVSQGLARFPKLFPDVLTHMVSVGEKTGSLAQTLIYLAELYETEVNDLTKNLSSSIEPVLMMVMGLIVGLIAVSIITPIYAITQHLSPR